MAKFAVRVSVLLVLLLVALAESSSNKYCCTRYQQKPVQVKWLKSYTVQDDNCKLRAIIFKTVKNRHICANPEDEWVKIAIQLLPRKP
ncbi:C-C motif chemokine 26 [Simochromis diagramma]|uniref:C-C motif chemokine 26 n=1 Tax=Simochromis diagramma TaxID=43689 RepID=UPI001A7E9D90|nr:C-C motif chemokine 26 [Simochromis diagramma]